jgi:hypothetical protein
VFPPCGTRAILCSLQYLKIRETWPTASGNRTRRL